MKLLHKFKKNKQVDLDKKLVFSLSKSRIPNLRQLKHISKFLSKKEIWALRFSFFTIFITSVIWGGFFYSNHLEIIPIKGGTYIEALVGSPKYINPLYSSVSDVDNDLSSLIFSSLYTRNKQGELEFDLVDSLEILNDGLVYKFKIKEGVKWHNDEPLNVDDIVFTYNAIINPQYKSNLRSSFIGVEIEKIDDYSFKFILKEPYAAFLELLTFGILPSKLWSQIMPETAQLAELNIKPIGSGLYKFKELKKAKNGVIKEYNLAINSNYYAKKAKVDLNFKLFSSFEEAVEALNAQEIDGISYLPSGTKERILTPNSFNFQRLYLPQTTLLFLNQDRNEALKDKAIRQALALAIDYNDIINDVLKGDAYRVYGPILANSFAYKQDIKKYEYNSSEAIKLLEQVDWKLATVTEEQINEAEDSEKDLLLVLKEGEWRKKNDKFLVVDLKTVDRVENILVVEKIKEAWEKIGVKVALEIVPISDIQTTVIRPRNFDALFYGQVLGQDPDPYVFWHSSEVKENGFNISNFVNKDVDALLEDARVSPEQNKRKEFYYKFQDIIQEEVPAIFMYSPIYTYLQTNNLKGFEVTNILLPKDRFSNINEWYLKTGKKLILD